MASLLETEIASIIWKGLRGKLLSGTLRHATLGAVDSYGDAAKTISTVSVEGIVDNYSAFYKKSAGIPESDVRILLLSGSTARVPQKDDQIKFRNQWYQVREVSKDPANATWVLQSFAIEDPT